jgi:hypothetical protein
MDGSRGALLPLAAAFRLRGLEADGSCLMWWGDG